MDGDREVWRGKGGESSSEGGWSDDRHPIVLLSLKCAIEGVSVTWNQPEQRHFCEDSRLGFLSFVEIICGAAGLGFHFPTCMHIQRNMQLTLGWRRAGKGGLPG